MTSPTYSVRDLCERYAVNEHTVLAWLHSGELVGLNVGRSSDKKKPRWRITAGALAAFEQLRTASSPHPQTRRRKRSTDVIEFYK
jgi:hypothetical protein